MAKTSPKVEFVYRLEPSDYVFLKALSEFTHEPEPVCVCTFILAHEDRGRTAQLICYQNKVDYEDFDIFYCDFKKEGCYIG